jgi:predicted Holliday junction resolvase-like endonuclease
MYKNIIITGVVAILIISISTYVYMLKKTITELNTSLLESKIELAKEQRQSALYRSTLDNQTKEIESLAVDKSKADKKLAEWRAKPADVRYEVIYKMREVKSDECADIKTVIDNIRNLDYSRL